MRLTQESQKRNSFVKNHISRVRFSVRRNKEVIHPSSRFVGGGDIEEKVRSNKHLNFRFGLGLIQPDFCKYQLRFRVDGGSIGFTLEHSWLASIIGLEGVNNRRRTTMNVSKRLELRKVKTIGKKTSHRGIEFGRN